MRSRDLSGAGDRDRTGMASLEGWGSTIELHPRVPRQRNGRVALLVRQAFSVAGDPSHTDLIGNLARRRGLDGSGGHIAAVGQQLGERQVCPGQ